MNANWLSAPSPEECAPFDATASSGTHCPDRGFEVGTRLGANRGLGRTGVIHTAHGVIRTPAVHRPSWPTPIISTSSRVPTLSTTPAALRLS